jgi:L-ascorbate metabolism protein UlaG (beta-lactamase superfamily)
MKLTWLGHSAFHLEMRGKHILLDPFFTGNSTFPVGYEEKLPRVDLIGLTHGHSDHVGDSVRLAKKFGSVIVAQPEICQYLGRSGLKNFQPMNIGGTIAVDDVSITMVTAQHSSTIVDDGVIVPLGDPAGLILRAEESVVYHAGDTGLFSDLALIQRFYRPSIGLIPIGDRFTMGPEAAAFACNEFLDLEKIIPIHWGTSPALTGRPELFADLVKRGKVVIPAPGETLDI